MQVRARSLAEEVRVTVEAGIELANRLGPGPAPGPGAGDAVRQVLVDHGFVRGPDASEAEIAEVARRFAPVAAIVLSLPDADLATAVTAVNEELAASQVAPSVVAHDGAPLHIHWARPGSTFGVQVVIDVLMALAQTLCESGTDRFGRCAAEAATGGSTTPRRTAPGSSAATPRCASRTHTARHRARLGTGTE